MGEIKDTPEGKVTKILPEISAKFEHDERTKKNWVTILYYPKSEPHDSPEWWNVDLAHSFLVEDIKIAKMIVEKINE